MTLPCLLQRKVSRKECHRDPFLGYDQAYTYCVGDCRLVFLIYTFRHLGSGALGASSKPGDYLV